MLERLVATILRAAILAALILAAAAVLGPPTMWRLPRAQYVVPVTAAVAWLVAIALHWLATRRGWQRTAVAALGGCAVFGAWLFMLLVWRPDLLADSAPARRAIIACVAVGIAGSLLLAPSRRPGTWIAAAAACVLAAAGLAVQVSYWQRWWPGPPVPERVTRLLDTSLYQLRVDEYLRYVPHHFRTGGGIEAWDDRFLLVTGDGRLYVFAENGNGGLDVTELPHRVPINPEEFVASAAEIYKDRPWKGVEAGVFRVAGALVMDSGGLRRVLVAHHWWDVQNSCFTLRLSALEGTPAELLAPDGGRSWRTVFDANPCLPLNTTNPAGPRFEGWENGGALARLQGDEILLTVGVHAFDGVTRPENYAQDDSSAYGKIMRIDVVTGEARVYTRGHRNAQGLLVAHDGSIWSSEHGPRGGDEINQIIEGQDYGFPSVTYGTDYAKRTWPLNDKPGFHDGYERPIYAFVPSIGPSAITEIVGPPFDRWEGDLVIGSLKGERLMRARIREERLIFSESMHIGRRIRDVHRTQDGRLLLWTDDSTIAFVAPTAVNRGEELAVQCTACHGFTEWIVSGERGPNLGGVAGRRVAGRDDYAYSDAMRAFGGRWTRERLDAFLADPQGTVPGTTMVFPGMPDPEERRLLIEYLENLAPPD